MKVLILAFGHPDNVLSLAKNLSQEVDLTVLFVTQGRRYQEGILDLNLEEIQEGVITEKSLIAKAFPTEILQFIDNKFGLWLLKLPSYRMVKPENWKMIYKLNQKIQQSDFDIVHFNGISGFMSLLYLLNKGKRGLAWTLHDFKSHSGEENKRGEKLNYFLAKRNKLFLVQHYEYLRKEVIKAFKLPSNKVQLLRSGVLEVIHAFKEEKITKQEDYVLFFGRISKYKGVDILLKAYTEIENPSKKLIIAGSGQFWFDDTPYQQNDNIIFINRYLQSGELAGLIRKASFIVVPYRDATHSAVVVMSYCFNKAIVSSNVDGLSEAVLHNKTGLLTAPGNIDDLKASLVLLMNNREKLESFERNIQQLKQEGAFAWDEIIANYVQFYNKLLVK